MLNIISRVSLNKHYGRRLCLPWFKSYQTYQTITNSITSTDLGKFSTMEQGYPFTDASLSILGLLWSKTETYWCIEKSVFFLDKIAKGTKHDLQQYIIAAAFIRWVFVFEYFLFLICRWCYWLNRLSSGSQPLRLDDNIHWV